MNLAIPAIRLALPTDAAHIAAMSRDYVEAGLSWSWTTARVLRSIADHASNVAVIADSEGMLGFGIMQYGDHTAHLALLAVHPGHRNRGLGTRLMGWLEKPAVVAGIVSIRLEARADNPLAIDFYRRRGFEPHGRIAGYYQGRIDAVRLGKSLGPALDGVA
ncbi:MAG: GNAT family N-acetyltransferase [Steroidobacteraceae bacterium]